MDPNMHIYSKSQGTQKIQNKLEQLQAQMLLHADQVSQQTSDNAGEPHNGC